MRQLGRDDALELGGEPMHAFGRQVEPEQLDGDEPIAFGIEPAKHRTQRAGANLMKDAKRTEPVWRRRTGSVRVQWKLPQEGS